MSCWVEYNIVYDWLVLSYEYMTSSSTYLAVFQNWSYDVVSALANDEAADRRRLSGLTGY